ncbi:MAG TPA: hypothetical protein VMB78_12425 [Dissulfurispiraceae bacterium]|nr:hypothetical protein [Dissulfurispiraceae bacterium]
MAQEKEDQIKLDFARRRRRQMIAIATTCISLVLLALVANHPDIFGSYARNDILSAQILLLAGFIWFNIYNWRCPLCKKSIGPDINIRVCRHCRTGLR